MPSPSAGLQERGAFSLLICYDKLKAKVEITSHARDDTQASLREAQSGSVADCAYISSERQFSSAAQGSAVHSSQNRHWQPRQACDALMRLEPGP